MSLSARIGRAEARVGVSSNDSRVVHLVAAKSDRAAAIELARQQGMTPGRDMLLFHGIEVDVDEPYSKAPYILSVKPLSNVLDEVAKSGRNIWEPETEAQRQGRHQCEYVREW